MNFSVNFLERLEGDSPSIERVFRSVAENISGQGISARFTQAAYGNSVLSTVRNLLFFRPEPAEIYHITGHISFMALVLPPDRTVLTIHDLTILDLRNGVRRWLIKWLYFILPARRATYLTAISNATKERLVKVAGIPSDRVRVIENPLLVSESAARDFNSSMPRILQIGTAPNKNVARLIEAIPGFSCHLRIIGPISKSLEKRLNDLNIKWSNALQLDDSEIEKEYEGADVVTLCSTDEGFGLPIIEAQAKGIAVVTSDRAPMNDVAGLGARLVDPESIESIKDGIVDLIENPSLRKRLVAEGKTNIGRFDARRIAGQYLEVYYEVIANQTKV